MTVKYLLFSFENSSDAVNFVEYIQSRLHGENVDIIVKGKKVKIVLHGGRQDLASLVALVRREYKSWLLSTTRSINGFYRHAITRLLYEAELEASIPVNSIADILLLKGFKAYIKGEYIETTADIATVLKVTEVFSRNYKKLLKFTGYTPMARRVVAIALTVCEEEEVELMTEKLIKMNVLLLDEKSGRKSLKVNYREAIDKIAELCGKHGDKDC